MTGSFTYDVSTESSGGYDKFTYVRESDASTQRALYEKTGQNTFDVDCEDVGQKYRDVCKATVGS